jgi:hypothetical protein
VNHEIVLKTSSIARPVTPMLFAWIRCTRQLLLRKTDRKSTDDRAQVLLPPLQELRVHLEDYLSLPSRRVRIKRVYSGQVSADYQIDP